MDLTRALYRAVHGYPAGTEALAATLQMNRTVLIHKVSPTYPGAHCSPEELANIAEATGDHGVLIALADRLGYVCVRMVAVEHQPTHDSLVGTIQEFGEFMAASSAGFADQRITDNEMARIEQEALEAMQAINDLVAKAKQLNQAGKPAELRELRSLKSERAQAHK